ncbi:hypothetical protein ACJIZ3_005995 [Penstemon smallii]|uniref:non-specific serine/threonine protein kinase n=1 Tax=Penstemon smallii TaxID=265156 RepID=A0ABD3S6Q4_9LAMI
MGRQVAIFLIFFYLMKVLCLAASPDLNISSSGDEHSLLAIKAHITFDANNILASNWSEGTNFCTWIGITCSRRHPRVTVLNLFNMSLEGTIAKEIGNLSFLTVLRIANNSLNGIIPDEIGSLRRLRRVHMSYNQLSGEIPLSFGLLTKLEFLGIEGNHLTGTIPWNIFNISSLQSIGFTGNKLYGTLPNDMCYHLPKLEGLYLSRNQLSGDIPTSLSACSQLNTLALYYNNFTGAIPMRMENLSQLQILALGSNKITGNNIPDVLCTQSANLQYLSLEQNRIYGEIPSSLTRCRMLQTLSLSLNQLTGSIPTEIWNLSSLKWFKVFRNSFTGSIPPSVGNLSNLMVLILEDNKIQGKIPQEIGRLSSLTYLDLGLNKLDGEIPQSIFNFSRLEMLTLAGNELSGTLPFSIDRGLPNLKNLYLDSNRLSGRIPNSISNISNLNKLDLSYNSFSGHIPITLGNLHNLERLSLEVNHFTNDLSVIEQDFLTSLANCTYLKIIWILDNYITGMIPKTIGSDNLSISLESFHASFCRISGTIPNEIGNLSNLISLDLGDNELNGIIPSTLGKLENLQSLDLSGNKLQGSIPTSFCNLRNMYQARLSGNRISRQLPTCLGNLLRLRELHLANNAFTSEIPSTLWSNEYIQIINFSNNFFDGPLPHETGNLKGLTVLDLSGNQFFGEIPITFGQLQSLNSLTLSNNKLQGPIPDFFDNLKDLEYLDLSRNNLSGVIPQSLETLTDLSYFNVSFNDLSGEIPNGGRFINFTIDSFRGNKGLCGASRFKINACKSSKLKSSRTNIFIRYIMPPMAFIFFASIIVILLLRYRARKSQLSPPSNSPLGLTHERLSYFEILRATNNLDEVNLIGRGSLGSVYKGIFSNGTTSAVKVFNLDVQGALKSFDIECQILRSIRHRNLVKVITSCSNHDFKAVIMEYMRNGNLDQWLYSPNYFLSIAQRLGIMIDVASAIEYLHHDYSSPIVHCDLKPGNILLDENMVARVGDFGIAKLLTNDRRMELTKTLGTIGYMAPEYGSAGLVSTSVDVYSYGILLMETFTRKKPTDEMFQGQLTLRSWVFGSLPNGIAKIVDVDLLNVDTENTRGKHEMLLTQIIELALECTTDSLEERLNMKDVLVRLKNIKIGVQKQQNRGRLN